MMTMQQYRKALDSTRHLMSRMEAREIGILHLLRNAPASEEVDKAINERAHLHWAVKFLAEDGMIAIVNGGRDCDNSRWDNAVSLVPATVKEVNKWLKEFYEHAEGPQHHRFESPSIAKTLKRTSRDLALEAFENGHPHHIIDSGPDWDEKEWDYATCEHGVYKGYVGGYCRECDAYEEKRGGLDKCLNCGAYKWGDQLNENQTCIKPCRNPNEY